MKKVAMYFSFLIIIISFFSCRESSVTPEEPIDAGLKLKKMISNSNALFTYKYENDIVISFEITKSDTTEFSMKMFYDGNNRIIRVEAETYDGFTSPNYSTYEYDNNGNISGQKYYELKSDGTSELKTSNIYVCDADGRVIKSIDAITNQVSCALTYNSYGNVTEINSFKNGQLINKDTYEYNTGLNPINKIAPFDFLRAEAMSKNTIIKSTFIGYSSGQKDETTNIFQYEYNSKNYPINLSYTTTMVYGDRTDIYSGHSKV